MKAKYKLSETHLACIARICSSADITDKPATVNYLLEILDECGLEAFGASFDDEVDLARRKRQLETQARATFALEDIPF